MADTFFSGEIIPGAPVVTLDGNQLGTVKEVRGRYFKVDAPMAPDYWLATDCIRSASANQVMLSVNGSSLDSYKYDKPDTDESGSRLSRATGTIDRDSTMTTEYVDDPSAFERSSDTRPTGMTESGERRETATDFRSTATPGESSRTERTTETTTRAGFGDRDMTDSATLPEEEPRAGKQVAQDRERVTGTERREKAELDRAGATQRARNERTRGSDTDERMGETQEMDRTSWREQHPGQV